MVSSNLRKFLIALVAFPALADACPQALAGLHTDHLPGFDLCGLYDQWQDLSQRLEARGSIPAAHVGNLFAPRFIESKKWLAKRDRTATAAWTAYEPAPVTWASWYRGAVVVDGMARTNLINGHLDPLTLEQVVAIQKAAVDGLDSKAGRIRTWSELGTAIERSDALTAKQIAEVTGHDFSSIANPDRGLMSFRPTVCLEDQSEAFRKAYAFSYAERPPFDLSQWAPVAPDRFFVASDGQSKQCGIIFYAPAEELAAQLKAWLDFVNQSSTALANPFAHGDPLLTAAHFQRWFIAIHPFLSGNGRTSRFIMDWFLESLGLPAPILAEMDDDIFLTDAEWADRIGEGLRRSIAFGRACLLRPGARGCQIVAPGQSPERN